LVATTNMRLLLLSEVRYRLNRPRTIIEDLRRIRTVAMSKWLALSASLLACNPINGVAAQTAQTYPNRPITMISPFPAGGPNDAIARTLAEHMRRSLSQPVIVENVGGASGSIGAGRVARAAADGYTILSAGWVSQVSNAAVYRLSYDVVKDFDPVALLATEPLIVVGRTSLPARDLRELIDWLKANPGRALQGTAGPGSVSHVAGVLFQKQTGTSFHFVPYRGASQILPDLVAGRIDIRIDLAASALSFIRAGAIKPYAVMARSRLPAAADIPTVDEAGLPDMYFSNWQALWLPSRTPADIVSKLNWAVVQALSDPGVRERLASNGREIPPRDQQTAEALRSLHMLEIEKWWPIIRAAGIKAE